MCMLRSANEESLVDDDVSCRCPETRDPAPASTEFQKTLGTSWAGSHGRGWTLEGKVNVQTGRNEPIEGHSWAVLSKPKRNNGRIERENNRSFRESVETGEAIYMRVACTLGILPVPAHPTSSCTIYDIRLCLYVQHGSNAWTVDEIGSDGNTTRVLCWVRGSAACMYGYECLYYRILFL